MEGRKKSDSSSFTTDLFGSKDSPASSSTGIFGSIFAPSSKVLSFFFFFFLWGNWGYLFFNPIVGSNAIKMSALKGYF